MIIALCIILLLLIVLVAFGLGYYTAKGKIEIKKVLVGKQAEQHRQLLDKQAKELHEKQKEAIEKQKEAVKVWENTVKSIVEFDELE